MLTQRKNQTGFSLIEMIVSLGVFSIIVTTAVGALLVLLANNQKLQGDQSVMTNLSFALDSMTREIRTGYNYYCDEFPHLHAGGNKNFFNDENSQEDLGEDTKDCSIIANEQGAAKKLRGLSFTEGGNSITTFAATRIAYFYDPDEEVMTIKRRVGDNDAQSIISSDLEILEANFFVTGSVPKSDASNDVEQPTVTIYIRAKEKGGTKEYNLQTTVTQRTLDL